MLKQSNTYQYEGRTYTININQLKILNTIKTLPKKHLHYLVGQQSNIHKNLSLKELKYFIKLGIKKYCKRLNIDFKNGDENKYVKYFCVYETTRDFFNSQHQNSIVREEIEMGIHFHLFITSSDTYSWVSFPSLFHSIYTELTRLRHKRKCISKFDYNKLNVLDENFILYHTKQFMYNPSSEMIMNNLPREKLPI